MPSLVQEDQLGFDVGFKKPGVPILLQFKLGQSLRRFVRKDKGYLAPILESPFFRFSIDTAEPDGQFETLLKAEQDGAETYYVAPRFADWPQYASFFEAGAVLENSISVTPSTIRNALDARESPDGVHRIVYDTTSIHVCSEPTQVSDTRPSSLAENVRTRLAEDPGDLSQIVHRIYEGFDHRALIRRPKLEESAQGAFVFSIHSSMAERTPEAQRKIERSQRLEQLRARARTEDDAFGAALGLELWALGIQLLFATGD
ncbi:hypothetical protein [uncultured Bradyrhizobium sp.]|jgi:hypothetical protein|uniref:hypothetical protein n=1 Tax=uncultured Bradyrhizobium sp. TaxID=199684 RepID=UPI00261C69D0|nr:hypothetical protein [uncultured Bradyrhizobium sp.]